MSINRNHAEGMSRNRFWQEVAITAFREQLRNRLTGRVVANWESFASEYAATLAKAAFAFADAMDKQHGPDDVPRGSAEAR